MQPFQIFVVVQPYLKQFGAIQTEDIDGRLATKMQRNGLMSLETDIVLRILFCQVNEQWFFPPVVVVMRYRTF